MMEIQSLTSRIHDLQRAFDCWTTGYVWFVAITAVLAIAVFFMQFMSVKRGKELSQAHSNLALIKDRQLSIALKEKDEKIAEANVRAAEAMLALEIFKSPRNLSRTQQAEFAEKLKQFAGTEYALSAKDAEPLDFALDIEHTLEMSGWIIKDWTGGGIVTNLPGRHFRVGNVVLSGVDVQIRDLTLSDARDVFVETLTQAGFENVRGSFSKASPDDPNRSVMHIMVGTKP